MSAKGKAGKTAIIRTEIAAILVGRQIDAVHRGLKRYAGVKARFRTRRDDPGRSWRKAEELKKRRGTIKNWDELRSIPF